MNALSSNPFSRTPSEGAGSLYQAILAQAALHPDRIALDDGTGAIRYGEIAGLVTSAAAVVRRTIGGAHGPVAIDMGNSTSWALADLTLLSMGLPSVAVPVFLGADEAEAYLHDAGAIAVITARGICQRRARGTIATLPGVAKITHGSAGPVRIADRTLLATATAIARHGDAAMAGVHVPVLPLATQLENVAGLYATLLAGGTCTLLSLRALGLGEPARPNFTALIGAIIDSQATSLILAPELLAGLVAAMEARRMRLPALRLVAVAGGVHPRLIERAAARGLPVSTGYGIDGSGSLRSIEAAGPGDDASGRTPAALAANGRILLGQPERQEVIAPTRPVARPRLLQAVTTAR